MSEDNTEFIQKRLDEFKKNDEYWETNPDAERPNSALDILKQMNNVGEKITTVSIHLYIRDLIVKSTSRYLIVKVVII